MRDLSNSKLSHDGSASSATSRTLIRRLQMNESPAWRELVYLYSPLIYHWCRKSGISEHDIGDIAQEVFRSVFSNVQTFHRNREGDTFRGWLRTITRNKLIDHFRRSNRQPHATGGTSANLLLTQAADDDDELVNDPDELQAEHDLFCRAIELIRGEFQQQTWQAFWQVAVEGQSANEVADALGMRPGTVRVAKSRVLKKLREQLGDLR